MRRSGLIAFSCAALCAGCIVTVGGGGGIGPDASATPSGVATVTVTVTVTPTPPGTVVVHVLDRPRMDPCPGVIVYSSLGDTSVDQAVTDATGTATLHVYPQGNDIAAEVVSATGDPKHAVAVLSVSAGDEVTLPAMCGPQALFNTHLTVTAAQPDFYVGLYGFEHEMTGAQVNGSTFSANVGQVVTTRPAEGGFSIFAYGFHVSGSGGIETGAAIDVPLGTPSVSITMQSSPMVSVPISLVDFPPAVLATNAVGIDTALTLEGERFGPIGHDSPAHPYTSPGGTAYFWGTGITGAGAISLWSPTSVGGHLILLYGLTDFTATTIDCSVLPPLPGPDISFDGTTVGWTVTSGGTASAGIVALGRDEAEARARVLVLFPPDLCHSGACSLRLPPAIRIAPSQIYGDYDVRYVWRPDLSNQIDAAALFFVPRIAPGLTVTSYAIPPHWDQAGVE